MRADVTIDLNVRNEIRTQWESIRKHDVVFLVCCRPVKATASLDPKQPFKERVRLILASNWQFQLLVYACREGGGGEVRYHIADYAGGGGNGGRVNTE